MRISPSTLAESKWSIANANNAVTTVTIAADANECWVIDSIVFGFTADPAAAALLTVTIGGVTKLTAPVLRGGLGILPLRSADDEGLYGSKNQAVVVTLAASGTGGVIGYLNVKYR